MEKELEKAFRYVKYYFPAYKTGNAILFLAPLIPREWLPPTRVSRSGCNNMPDRIFPFINPHRDRNFFLYISRRFAPEYITANCMKAVADDIFPDQSRGKPLIEQMIEKGKQWYLLDKFLPNAPDSVKTGYTQQQLKWCRENEGLIWSYLVKNEDLNSLNPAVIQTYIGEGPFTQGFSQDFSPGNLGQWIGWQLVKKFVAKNPGMKPADVMRTEARKILEEAKYKPK